MKIGCWRLLVSLSVSVGMAASPAFSASYTSQAPGTGVMVDTPCRDGHTLDPYQVWQQVTTEEQAKSFLREQYDKQGSLDDFLNWLVCQDFSVGVYLGPATSLRAGQRMIEATFFIKPKKRIPLWELDFGWFPLSPDPALIWSQRFAIWINSDQKIFAVDHGASSK